MTLGSFISPFGGTAAGSTSSSGDDLAMFQALHSIEEAERTGDAAPVILWIARSATLNISVPIPRHVTLSFAPGAVLTLSPSARLDIQGRLDAGTERRFDLRADARVFLRGPLDEIHAAWWGADADAITHALNVLWDRYEHGSEPAPVQLSGPYHLEAPVRVEPPAAVTRQDQLVDVVIRGRHYGARSPMTFQVKDVDQVGGMDALLAIDGKVTLTLENVRFDVTRSSGRPGARSALTLAGDHDRSLIEGCTFRLGNAKGIDVTVLGLVWRDAFLDSSRGLSAGVGFGALLILLAGLAAASRKADRVSVSRCDFEGVLPDKAASAIPIAVDATAPTMMDVSDCQFRGAYDCAIAFMGSDLVVTHCAFDCTTNPDAADPLRGVDIHLGPRDPSASDAGGLIASTAHLTVTHCVSTSSTFLVGRQPPSSTRSGGALLTNVLHLPRSTPSSDGASSIRWIGPYDRRSLTLQGCELGAPVLLLGVAAEGAVVNLGTRFVGLSGTREEIIGGSADSVVGLFSPIEPPRT